MGSSKIKSLVKINSIAVDCYKKCLQNSNEANKILLSRISQKTIDKFNLGLSKQSRLIRVLNKNNCSTEDAQAIGLIHVSQNGHCYEAFINRIMIPIYLGNWPIGFGARVIGKSDKAKYINSKASVLYNKSDVLYGLSHSRKFIKEKEYVIVVEGYFDFLSLYDKGIKNVVAICGTAITYQQLTLLYRYTDTAVLVLDGDTTGANTMKKYEKLYRNMPIDLFPLYLPNNLDPEEYINKYSKKKLVKKIERSF